MSRVPGIQLPGLQLYSAATPDHVPANSVRWECMRVTLALGINGAGTAGFPRGPHQRTRHPSLTQNGSGNGPTTAGPFERAEPGSAKGGKKLFHQKLKYRNGPSNTTLGIHAEETKTGKDTWMDGCESWTMKKAERQRVDAFELWCWRRLLRIPWTARRSNQPILRENEWIRSCGTYMQWNTTQP